MQVPPRARRTDPASVGRAVGTSVSLLQPRYKMSPIRLLAWIRRRIVLPRDAHQPVQPTSRPQVEVLEDRLPPGDVGLSVMADPFGYYSSGATRVSSGDPDLTYASGGMGQPYTPSYYAPLSPY